MGNSTREERYPEKKGLPSHRGKKGGTVCCAGGRDRPTTGGRLARRPAGEDGRRTHPFPTHGGGIETPSITGRRNESHLFGAARLFTNTVLRRPPRGIQQHNLGGGGRFCRPKKRRVRNSTGARSLPVAFDIALDRRGPKELRTSGLGEW